MELKSFRVKICWLKAKTKLPVYSEVEDLMLVKEIIR